MSENLSVGVLLVISIPKQEKMHTVTGKYWLLHDLHFPPAFSQIATAI